MVHQDVKAADVLVFGKCGKPDLQLTDFGSAVLVDPATRTAGVGHLRCVPSLPYLI